MQAIGLILIWAGYTGVYWAIQLTNSSSQHTTGSALYWATGIDSLGAPKDISSKPSKSNTQKAGKAAQGSGIPPGTTISVD